MPKRVKFNLRNSTQNMSDGKLKFLLICSLNNNRSSSIADEEEKPATGELFSKIVTLSQRLEKLKFCPTKKYQTILMDIKNMIINNELDSIDFVIKILGEKSDAIKNFLAISDLEESLLKIGQLLHETEALDIFSYIEDDIEDLKGHFMAFTSSLRNIQQKLQQKPNSLQKDPVQVRTSQRSLSKEKERHIDISTEASEPNSSKNSMRNQSLEKKSSDEDFWVSFI